MTQTRRTEAHPAAGVDREALAQAIEKKVHRLGTPALLRLAESLKVAVPETSVPVRPRRAMRPPAAATADVTDVLRGKGVGPVMSARRGLRVLDDMAVEDEALDWAESELLGAGELATRLGVTRGTIDNWRTAGRIIGFRKGLRNYVFPVRQFERMQPLTGLQAVIAEFDTEEDAWDWLVTPNVTLGGMIPIDLLRDGEAARVVTAARGALDYA